MKKRKIIFIFILVSIISITTVYGSILIQSDTVRYDNTESGLKDNAGNDVTTVKQALDELYSIHNDPIRNSCSDGYTGVRIDDVKYKCVKNELLQKKSITLQVGDVVQMTPTLDSFTTDMNMTYYKQTQTFNPQELNLWKVIRVNNDNGTITYDAVSEYTSSTNISFGGGWQYWEPTFHQYAVTNGASAYKNYIGYLNVLASKYENSNFTVGSRYIGYSGQTEYIEDMSYFDGSSTKASTDWKGSTDNNTSSSDEQLGRGDVGYTTDIDLVKAQYNNSVTAYKMNPDGTPSKTKDAYWLASRFYSYYYASSVLKFGFYPRIVTKTGTISKDIAIKEYASSKWTQNADSYSLRPIITLKSNLQATGLGTYEYPYILQQ